MASVSELLNQEQFAALKGGDESVLEKAVRGSFATLVDLARTKLGNDAASAPRVVVISFLQAWKARERFDSARSLDDFLKDAIDRVAADEHHRRESVHRLNEKKGTAAVAPGPVTQADIDKAWTDMQGRLHPAMEERANTRRAVGTAARHNTAANMMGATKRKVPYVTLGVGVVIVGVIAVALKMVDRNKDEFELGKALATAEVRDVPTSRGQRGSLKLSDSTAVQLGAESRMKVPPGFNAQVRGVGINGAAQFTVAPATGVKPMTFRARVREVSVEAKDQGTVFAVRSFDEDPDVLVMVRQGSVDVRPIAKSSKPMTLAVGPGMAVAKDGTTRTLSQAESDAAFSWTDGTIALNQMPLIKTIDMLYRWFGTTIKLPDQSMGTRPVTTTIKLESSAEAMDLIAASANAHVGFRGDTLVFENGAVPAKAKPAAKAKAKGK